LVGFTAHPEGFILGKLIYYQQGGSDKHLRDIAGMLRISRNEIDLERLRVWASKLGVAEHLSIVLARSLP
jgi:hypothetical protein